MLDVHPAQHAASTWRDFFIHIATIVIGLLIALGLEQTVEYFHHRIEVKRTREELRLEREANRRSFDVNSSSSQWQAVQLKNNLRVLTFLEQHPGTPEEKLPGVLAWGFLHDQFAESSWKSAQQRDVLALMPQVEAEADAKLYELLDVTDQDELSAHDAVSRAGSYCNVDPNPSHMTLSQLTAEIGLLQEAMRANQNWAGHLMNVHQRYPDFSPGPDLNAATLNSQWQRSAEDQKKLTAAQAITDKDLATAQSALMAATKAAADTH